MKSSYPNKFIVVAVLLVAGLISCRGCERVKKVSPLELAASTSNAAIYVPNLRTAQTKAEAFVSRATRKAGSAIVLRTRDGIKKQFGFDPLAAGDLDEFGINSDSGLLLFAEGEQSVPLLALAVSDRPKVDGFLRTVMKTLEGAGEHSEEKHDGVAIFSAGRPFGTETVASLHWAHLGGFVLIARAGGLDALKAAIGRNTTPQGSGAGGAGEQPASHLGEDPLFLELQAKVPAGLAQIFIRGDGGDLLASMGGPLSRGVMTSVAVGPEGFSTDSYIDTTVPGLGAALQGKGVLPLANRLQQDAALAFLSRAAKPEAVAALRAHTMAGTMLDFALKPLSQAMHLDLEKEVMPLLAGPFTISAHLGDVLQGLGQFQKHRNLNRVLDFIHVAIIADVKDTAAMASLLERNAAALSEQGTPVAKRTAKFGEHEAAIYEPIKASAQGKPAQFGWALWQGLYVYGAGQGRLDTTLTFLAENQVAASMGPSLQASSAQGLLQEEGASVLLLRLPAVAQSVSGMNAGNGAAGLGLDMMMKSAVNLLETLGDVAIGFKSEDNGLYLKIRQQLQ